MENSRTRAPDTERMATMPPARTTTICSSELHPHAANGPRAWLRVDEKVPSLVELTWTGGAVVLREGGSSSHRKDPKVAPEDEVMRMMGFAAVPVTITIWLSSRMSAIGPPNAPAHTLRMVMPASCHAGSCTQCVAAVLAAWDAISDTPMH